MKRIALFTLPLLATFVVVGIGLLLARTLGPSVKPRIEDARATITEAIGEVVVAVEEATA